MKKLVVPIAIAVALVVSGCTGASTATSGSSQSEQPAEVAAEVPDLVGDWKQTNSESEDSYQQATITADTISVDWVSDGGETTSIYWVGTFEAPTDSTEPYVWSSVRDEEATDSAMLASGDDAKEFTFEGDVISYKLTALGTTVTVKLAKS